MLGQTLNHYKILEKIGAGGMGEVYRAEDTTLDRQVALKTLPPDLAADPDRLARFEREAKALAALDHPNIVTIYSVETAGRSEEETFRFLTMQLVEGRPLTELIPRGGMPLERLFEIAIPLADALAAAHERGVIHRDLKPANIMITPEGRVKVLDFGLAKLRPETETSAASELPTEPLTAAGRVVGTIPYMSPEQLEGRQIDARSDIFALGVVLYEMATGERPFTGDTSASLIMSIGRDTPVAADVLRKELPHHLGRIIRLCLMKDPDGRPQTATGVRNQMRDLATELSTTQPPSITADSSPRAPGLGGRWPWLATVALAIVTVTALVLVFSRPRPPMAPPADDDPITSIAVLPLRNLSGDPSQEYFADGMTDALISSLSQISALKVISLTSVMRFKETQKPLPEIAVELGVGALVEGSVLHSGTRVRISSKLIHGKTDQHLWAESYTRELEDVLALHSELAQTIARQIRVTLTSEEKARLASTRPVDPAAHDALLKARHYLSRLTTEGRGKALASIQRAIELDPGFAPAHAALAGYYSSVTVFGGLAPREAAPRSESALLRALELDPTLAAAHEELGDYRLYYERDWQGAEEAFQRSLELSAGSTSARSSLAKLLAATGRHGDAIAEMKRALELDPLNLTLNLHLGWHQYYARRYDEAERQLQATLDLDPNWWDGHYHLGQTYEQQGRLDQAIAELERAVTLASNPVSQAGLGHALALAGRRKDALELAHGLENEADQSYVPSYQIAAIYAGLVDTDRAFAWLDRAVEERDWWLSFVAIDPMLDPIRTDPRFAALLGRLDLEDGPSAGYRPSAASSR